MLAPCIIPRLISHRKNTNHLMFREIVIKSITFELVGYFFIYITIEVMQESCL